MLIFLYMENANPKGKQFKFLTDLDLDQDVQKRLAGFLTNVVKGSDNVLMTPIGKEIGPNFILAKWDKIFEANKHRMNSVLLDYELSERSKFGPRSIAKPWSKRQGDVLSYFKIKNVRINSSVKSLLSEVNGDLRPLKISNAVKLLKNNTNAGLPYFKAKSLVKPTLVQNFDELISRKDPCILFTRTQEGGKTRTVWGYPIADTLNEMMYYKPLLDRQVNLFWRSALRGTFDVDSAITEIIHKARAMNKFLVSADFSAFDASVGEILIICAFNYIKKLFQKQYHRDIDYIMDRFINIGLLTPSGVFRGKHGIPSGSTFTNEVDSLVQYLVALSSEVVDKDLLQIQGDDGVYVMNKEDFDSLIETFTRAGLILNKDKSYLSQEYVIYLRNLYHIDYEKDGIIGGIYPTYRALTRLVYQERFTDLEDIGLTGQDYFSLRSYSILENCKCHPLFEEFVKFIKSIDKYALAYSQKGVNKYKELLTSTSGAEGIIHRRYGDDISGIRGFESFKIANNKA